MSRAVVSWAATAFRSPPGSSGRSTHTTARAGHVRTGRPARRRGSGPAPGAATGRRRPRPWDASSRGAV
ncbi:hypothetical protein PV779_19755 [Streptomyces sp. ID01-9D]|nr:hypothetical protein [Streptomyces sp. ID01-9D]